MSRQDWKRQTTKGTTVVLGMTITFPKEGVPVIANRLFADEVLGELVQTLVDERLAGGGKLEGKDALEKAKAALASVSKAGAAKGLTAGAAVRRLVGGIVPLLINVLAASAEMADEEERDEFRGWLRSLELTPLFDVVAGYVQVQFPAHYGPFVDLTAQALMFLEETKADLKAGFAKDAPAAAAEPDPGTESLAA